MQKTKEEALDLIEKAFKVKVSSEQKQILYSNFNYAKLINACAGAGKTTTFIWITLFLQMRGLKGSDILGVTFSKKAQLDMERKYEEALDVLLAEGININEFENPKFSTFHALFYQTLRTLPQYRKFKVASSGYKQFRYHFKLPKPSDYLTEDEQLEEIFNAYDFLINHLYTIDGLNPNIYNDTVKLLAQSSGELNMQRLINFVYKTTVSPDWYKNYEYAIKLYRDLKTKGNYMDFTDMQLWLLAELGNSEYQAVLRKTLENYKLAVLDEFQDINEIQWRLTKMLLPAKTGNRIIAIGDDDQAIYTFRGSEPDIILNFKNKMPKAEVFNLSTNYRTGGKILDTVKDSIRSNELRLDKSLQAFNDKQGFVYVDKGIANNNGKDILETLSENIQTKLNKETHAVLVRYNSDKAFVAEYLARQGVYVNLGKEYLILQNKTLFKTYYQLMRAFYYDSFEIFLEYANRIGFSKYKKHVNDLNARQEMDFQTITEYIKKSLYKNEYTGAQIYKFDRSVKATLDAFVEGKKNNYDTQYFLHQIVLLLKTYFDFMVVEKHFYSSDDYDSIVKFLSKQAEEYSRFEDFEETNEDNRINLEKVIEENKNVPRLVVDTIHGSKGLEWDNVYLYGLDDRELKTSNIVLAEKFKSNMSFDDFIDYLTNTSPIHVLETLIQGGGKILQYLPNWLNLLAEQSFNANIPAIVIPCITCNFKNLQETVYYPRITKNVYNIKSFVSDENTQLHYATKLLYQDIINNAKFVEDERRLLYVGVTRAKKRLYLQIPENENPLLNEMLVFDNTKSFQQSVV